MIPTDETTSQSPLKVYCDATTQSHGNPDQHGISAVGYVVTNHNGRMLGTGGRTIGKGYGSNEAERQAVCAALDAVSVPDVQHVIAYTDCEPVVETVTNNVRDEYSDEFESLTLSWIARDDNVVAHREAMIEAEQSLAGPTVEQPAQTKYGVMD
jgi:ribonuclease HI